MIGRSAYDVILRFAVELARRASLPTGGQALEEPQRGDFVVECTRFDCDIDAIGVLVGHGQAPYNEDETGPTREVWDILPLSGNLPPGKHYQRWENADFRKVPDEIVEHAGLRAPLPELLPQ